MWGRPGGALSRHYSLTEWILQGILRGQPNTCSGSEQGSRAFAGGTAGHGFPPLGESVHPGKASHLKGQRLRAHWVSTKAMTGTRLRWQGGDSTLGPQSVCLLSPQGVSGSEKQQHPLPSAKVCCLAVPAQVTGQHLARSGPQNQHRQECKGGRTEVRLCLYTCWCLGVEYPSLWSAWHFYLHFKTQF